MNCGHVECECIPVVFGAVPGLLLYCGLATMVQSPSIVALSDCYVHKQTATVAMHANGNDTGSSLKSWVLNYITTSCGGSSIVLCVCKEQIGEF